MRGSSPLFFSHAVANAKPNARLTGTATAFPIWRYLQPKFNHFSVCSLQSTQRKVGAHKKYVAYLSLTDP